MRLCLSKVEAYRYHPAGGPAGGRSGVGTAGPGAPYRLLRPRGNTPREGGHLLTPIRVFVHSWRRYERRWELWGSSATTCITTGWWSPKSKLMARSKPARGICSGTLLMQALPRLVWAPMCAGSRRMALVVVTDGLVQSSWCATQRRGAAWTWPAWSGQGLYVASMLRFTNGINKMRDAGYAHMLSSAC